MSVVWLTFALCAPAAAGWVQLGPERGHVLHAAVGEHQAAVATRVGVLTAGAGLEDWARDSRFPPEVRRLAYGPEDLVWGAPAGQLWRVDERAERVVFFESPTTAVDLAVTGSGALLAALRGQEAGVLRVQDQGVERVLEGVDAWCLAVEGERALLGTVDAGLYESTDDGRSFAPLLALDQGVSAVGLLDGEAWLGLADGGLRVLRDDGWHELRAVQRGFATGFARVPQGVLVTVQRQSQSHDSLLLFQGDEGREVQPGRMGGDTTVVDLTGAWSMPDGRALVGSFRRGPLVYGAQGLEVARDGFRATITGGAAADSTGRIVLALMGTGVYISSDAGKSWQSPPGGSGPVTDSVAVVAQGDEVLVVDFEGVAVLDAQGQWRRLPANPMLQPGQNLASVGKGANGTLWAVDRVGQLFQLNDQSWQACEQRGLRLDGHGEHLVMATPGGFLAAAGCDQPWPALSLDTDPSLDGRHARAAGGWVAGAGAVWLHGKKRFAIPLRPVSAVAAQDDRLLVALEDGSILSCAERCDPLPDALPGAVAALGWLPDGRVWAAELAGTFLVQGEGPPIPPWSAVRDARRVTGDLMPLERAPWNDEAAPQGGLGPGPVQHGGPGPAQPGGPQGPALPGGPQGPPLGPQPDQGAQAPVASEPGCGCTSAGQGPWGPAWLLSGLALAWRRRRC